MYKDTNIIPIPFDSKNEFASCFKILIDKYSLNDIFITGAHKSYLKSKITKQIDRINNDVFIPTHYNFGIDFYKDINLNPSIMFEYFNIKICDEIKELYNQIKDYKIIFIHSESSESVINLNAIKEKFINNNEYLVISANENIYNPNSLKYSIASKYIKLPTIIHYSEILIQAEELHMVDSSISCLALCFKLSNKLNCKDFQIYNRFTSQPIDLSV